MAAETLLQYMAEFHLSGPLSAYYLEVVLYLGWYVRDMCCMYVQHQQNRDKSIPLPGFSLFPTLKIGF